MAPLSAHRRTYNDDIRDLKHALDDVQEEERGAKRLRFAHELYGNDRRDKRVTRN